MQFIVPTSRLKDELGMTSDGKTIQSLTLAHENKISLIIVICWFSRAIICDILSFKLCSSSSSGTPDTGQWRKFLLASGMTVKFLPKSVKRGHFYLVSTQTFCERESESKLQMG